LDFFKVKHTKVVRIEFQALLELRIVVCALIDLLKVVWNCFYYLQVLVLIEKWRLHLNFLLVSLDGYPIA
jgi:hypothetical protein